MVLADAADVFLKQRHLVALPGDTGGLNRFAQRPVEHDEVLELLFKASSPPESLAVAIERQDWEAIGRLGLATPEACAATDGEGYAPLHWAQIKGAPPEVWEAIRAAGPEPPPPIPHSGDADEEIPLFALGVPPDGGALFRSRDTKARSPSPGTPALLCPCHFWPCPEAR